MTTKIHVKFVKNAQECREILGVDKESAIKRSNRHIENYH